MNPVKELKALGYTQVKIAKAVGKTQQFVSMVENDDRNTPIDWYPILMQLKKEALLRQSDNKYQTEHRKEAHGLSQRG